MRLDMYLLVDMDDLFHAVSFCVPIWRLLGRRQCTGGCGWVCEMKVFEVTEDQVASCMMLWLGPPCGVVVAQSRI